MTTNVENMSKAMQAIVSTHEATSVTNLQRERDNWERGLTVCTEMAHPADMARPHKLLVVLSKEVNGETEYHCHRYFQIGDEWNTSVDGQMVPLERVWEWLSDPKALRRN